MLKKSIAFKPKVGGRRPGPGPKPGSQSTPRPSTEELPSKTPALAPISSASPSEEPSLSHPAPHQTPSAPLDVSTPVSSNTASGDASAALQSHQLVDRAVVEPPPQARTAKATRSLSQTIATGGGDKDLTPTSPLTAPDKGTADTSQAENLSSRGASIVEEPLPPETPVIGKSTSRKEPSAAVPASVAATASTGSAPSTGPVSAAPTPGTAPSQTVSVARNTQSAAPKDQPVQVPIPPPADAPSTQPEPAAPAVATVESSSGPSRTTKPPRGRKRKSDTEAGGDSSGQSSAAPTTKRPRRVAAPLPGEEGNEPRRAVARAPRSQKRSSRATESGETGEDGEGSAARRSRKPSRPQREATPEDAENVQIDITQVKMADLVKDMHIGKKFSMHDELMERERAKRLRYNEKRRQQQIGENPDDAANGEEAQVSTGAASSSSNPTSTPAAAAAAADNGTNPDSPPARAGPTLGERYQLINGEIVLDPTSLIVDRHARAREAAATMQEVEENDFTYHITSSTYLRRNLKPQQWTDEETEKFYQALAAFGTDFDTIGRMFKGKTRKHIKLKFNREERVNPQRINAALVGQKTVGMLTVDEYKAQTGQEYETAEAIYAEQKRAEEEFEARQRAIDDEKAEDARRKKEDAMKQLEVSLAKERGGPKRGRRSRKERDVVD
ncbi:hypothetical protein MFIFM68171_10440 [Madurella fahalii]|uniref:Myb-like domain-containing protein n=1 Tax=Madurella fahalii TaxID=1157608 RepID=A0ABQ0GR83_9PEZI